MRELIKGWLGEKMTTFGMWLKLEQEVYRRVHNVILPARNGTTQIDHVVVSIYGLFVIETKNMEGWIFGSAQQETWTQQFFTKKVDPCLHLKSSKDFSLEIFEHARSHNTENASELTVSAQTYSEPLPSEQSIMGCSSYGSRNARHFASVKMALATARAFGGGKAITDLS